MRAVAQHEGTVMQVRHVKPGETVGYGATWEARRPSRIAVLGAGYKDGVPRALSSKAQDGPAQVFIGGRRCPIVGRISMDMMGVDITDLTPHSVVRGTRAEILGRNVSSDEAAGWARARAYEG